MGRFLILVLAIFLPFAVWAEEVVLGLSHDEVSITTRFDGSDILIFGAVKRESPIVIDPPLEVVITIAGPSDPVLVRRKARRAGIWVNAEAVEVDLAPSFYAVATSGPIEDVLSDVENLRHQINVERAIRSVGAPPDIPDPYAFTNALVRLRSEAGLYQLDEGAVVLDQQTLFRASVALPANLTEGDYVTRIYLTRNGAVVSDYTTVIDVRKVGLERWLFILSREQPLIYGLMALAIAVAAGSAASAVFGMLRR